MAAPGRPADGPASRKRHIGSAIPLLGMAVFATWNVLNNADWMDVVLPLGSQFRADVALACLLAVVCWAGGLGLLTRTAAGVWLGRLGAAVLLLLGAWFLWDHLANPTGSILFGDPLLIVVPVSALLMGVAIGILVALQPRGGRRETAGPPSGHEV